MTQANDIIMILTSLSLGITLAAAAGMRVFLPLLMAGIVLRFGLFSLPTDVMASQSWLGSTPALICFGVAAVTEALAYKIPYLDHLLDVIAAPAAVVAGAVLASTFLLGIDDPVTKYSLGIVAGAGSAGIVHGATAVTRVLSTKTTGGLANPVFSLTELIGSFVTSILAFVMPIVGAIAAIVFVIVVFIVLSRRFKKKQQLTAR